MRALGIVVAVVLAGCDGSLVIDRDAGRSDSATDPPDGGPDDASASADAAFPDAGPPPLVGPVLYPAGQRHSPITSDLAERYREVAARDDTLLSDVFMKAGASSTVSTNFLHCFAGTNVNLDGRPLDATLTRFRNGSAAGVSPFVRVSECATIGWSANAPLAGDPAPLEIEHAAIGPRFAAVMYGTNDVGFRTIDAFARDLDRIAELLLDWGTIPLMTTIPPRDDDPLVDARVPLFNLAIRAIAQGRGVPLIDYHRELSMLPHHGLSADGVHPTASPLGACVLTQAGLLHGYNIRNLITLEQLDRAARALDGETLDPDAPRLTGQGTADDPHPVAIFPFAVRGDTRRSTSRMIDQYGCSTSNESGPEVVYQLVLDAPRRVTAAAVSMSGVDVDIHLLRDRFAADACIARDNRSVTVDLSAGTYFIVADSFVSSSGAELAGEYLLLVSVE